jgi:hypothetical protein
MVRKVTARHPSKSNRSVQPNLTALTFIHTAVTDISNRLLDVGRQIVSSRLPECCVLELDLPKAMDEDCIHSLLQTDVRVPVSTYRTQMHKGFTFDQAAAIAPYLRRLGVGDLYASPIFEARPGSMHGYDVTRHDRLNPELGGAERFGPFAQTLREHEMGLLLDIVPNHMGIGRDSVW